MELDGKNITQYRTMWPRSNPQGGKFARMFAPPEWQVGDWYVARYAAWTEPFIGQITTFPNATHDMAERLKGNPVGHWLYKEKGYVQLSSSRDILTLSDGRLLPV